VSSFANGKVSTATKGRMVLRRKPLDAEMWSSYLGMEIEGALAALQRICAYWNASLPNPWIATVPVDNQGLYETLYQDLVFVLAQRPGMDIAAEEIRALVLDADALSAEDMELYGDEVRAGILGQMTRARNILNRLVIADGKPFGPSRVDALFDVFDGELNWMATTSKASAEAIATRLGILKAPERTPSPPAKGRPKGSTHFTLDEVRAKLGQFRADGRDLDLASFLQYLHVSDSTWKRWMREWKTSWTTLKRDVS